jgi:hypothetical protein
VRSCSTTINESASTFQIGRASYKSSEIEAVIGKRCKAVALSRKPWPACLSMCNHADEPGHESATSSAHKFTEAMLKKLDEIRQDF